MGREGPQHPDRDARFRYINSQVRRFQKAEQLTISVDTKKKELIGDFKNQGREWRPAGDPETVRVHDFLIPEQGKEIPYGVYDLQRNEGWVSVGIDHDTASFAVNSIRRWWKRMGRPLYPGANELLLTADAGGSNGSRLRLWKWELQKFANRTGLAISVCHFPPATSKWNKIEHRLFSHIAMKPARQTPRELGHGRQSDRLHAERSRPPNSHGHRPRALSQRRPRHRRPDGKDLSQSPPLPRELELHDSPNHMMMTTSPITQLFTDGPLGSPSPVPPCYPGGSVSTARHRYHAVALRHGR